MDIQDVLSKLRSSDQNPDSEPILHPEFDDVLPPDPPPARRTEKSRPKPPPTKPTKAIQTQVSDALTMMITLPAGMWSMRDPICGTALMEQSDAIVARLTPIVCRNPAMLRWFTEGAGYMDWIALATAIAPVVRTVWAHHVSHELDVEEQEESDVQQYSAPRYPSAEWS